MRQINNELEGFVLFQGPRSGYDASVGLIVTKSYIRLTGGAFRQSGNPQFFDEYGKRMMVKKAEKSMANTFKIDPKGYVNSHTVRIYLLNLIGIDDIDKRIRFEGHNPKISDTVIFDLSKFREER